MKGQRLSERLKSCFHTPQVLNGHGSCIWVSYSRSSVVLEGFYLGWFDRGGFDDRIDLVPLTPKNEPLDVLNGEKVSGQQ